MGGEKKLPKDSGSGHLKFDRRASSMGGTKRRRETRGDREGEAEVQKGGESTPGRGTLPMQPNIASVEMSVREERAESVSVLCTWSKRYLPLI